MKHPDCKHCGVPPIMCTCGYPDVIYNTGDIVRAEPITNREISPEEGLSDYRKTKLFEDAYLYGREGAI